MATILERLEDEDGSTEGLISRHEAAREIRRLMSLIEEARQIAEASISLIQRDRDTDRLESTLTWLESQWEGFDEKVRSGKGEESDNAD